MELRIISKTFQRISRDFKVHVNRVQTVALKTKLKLKSLSGLGFYLQCSMNFCHEPIITTLDPSEKHELYFSVLAEYSMILCLFPFLKSDSICRQGVED